MSEDAFRQWFADFGEALVRAVFRCVQKRCGGSLQDAEDGVQIVLTNLLTRWNVYRDRIYEDDAGAVRIGRKPGETGQLLYSYIVAAACNEAAKIRRRNRSDPFDDQGTPPASGNDPSAPTRGQEYDDGFRKCLARLDVGLHEAIRSRYCDDQPSGTPNYRLIYKALDTLRRCLVASRWRIEDLIDVPTNMQAIICA